MTLQVTNAQRALPVDTAHMRRLAHRAIRRLRIRTPGRLSITFVDSRRMRALNQRFLRHDRSTDVLSFRYDGEPARLPRDARRGQVVGEILIAPAQARTYARTHGIPYGEELSRYVLHGLLHWLGHEDRTRSQQRRMRALEDQLLRACGTGNGAAWKQRHGHSHR